MRFAPGDDVVLELDGIEHPAEVISHHGRWVLAVMIPDPLADYGSGSERIDPVRQTVCVPDTRVRAADLS